MVLYNILVKIGESHRWIDMRRFGRLGELPNDRPGDSVPEAVPIPKDDDQ